MISAPFVMTLALHSISFAATTSSARAPWTGVYAGAQGTAIGTKRMGGTG
jgi:hypothetical protein